MAFDATLEVRPEVSVAGYGGLRVELPAIAVTDEEVEVETASELKRFGTLGDLDRPAAIGDYVVVDLAATRDDEPVPGLNADDWSYEIGQGWVSEDFDEQLVAASPGDELKFSTTPKGTAESVDVTITVSRVQELVAPELTDEWVSENLGEYQTVAEWTDAIRAKLADTKLNRARSELIGRMTGELTKLTDVEPPAALVNTDLRRRVEALPANSPGVGSTSSNFSRRPGRTPIPSSSAFAPNRSKRSGSTWRCEP